MALRALTKLRSSCWPGVLANAIAIDGAAFKSPSASQLKFVAADRSALSCFLPAFLSPRPDVEQGSPLNMAATANDTPAVLQNGSLVASNGDINLTYAGMHARLPTDLNVLFVLGGPGSGKGTQCAKLVRDFSMAHLSAGDLLRAHMTSGTPDGQMVADMIKQGQIVPSHVTISLLEKAIVESGKSLVLIDGFPRNEENRAAFEKQTGIQPKFVLFFDCPEDVLERRLLGRNEGRSDDNIETIRKRFKVFMDSSLPVIQYYEARGKVRRIDANRPVDQVYADVKILFEVLEAKAAVPAP